MTEAVTAIPGSRVINGRQVPEVGTWVIDPSHAAFEFVARHPDGQAALILGNAWECAETCTGWARQWHARGQGRVGRLAWLTVECLATPALVAAARAILGLAPYSG